MKGMTDNPDLSKLQSIELEYSACRGDSDSSRTTMKNKPYNYKNTLTMRSRFVLRGVMARSPFLNQLQRKRKQFHMYWFCDSGE